MRSVWGDHVKSDKGLLNTQQGETSRDGITPSVSVAGSHGPVKTPLIYHELFGCYVPSLWTLRTVRTDCSSFYQQFTGTDRANV